MEGFNISLHLRAHDYEEWYPDAGDTSTDGPAAATPAQSQSPLLLQCSLWIPDEDHSTRYGCIDIHVVFANNWLFSTIEYLNDIHVNCGFWTKACELALYLSFVAHLHWRLDSPGHEGGWQGIGWMDHRYRTGMCVVKGTQLSFNICLPTKHPH